MNEERMKILKMLGEGKITSEEADKLIEALGASAPKAVERTVGPDGLPKYLYVNVNSFKENGEEKKENVSIKVPMALIKAGVNIASLMPEDVQGEINKAMDEKGVKFNLSDIKKENLDEFLLALRELEVNVDGENERVRIYCQ
jgi:hypothetical protein